MNMIDPIQVIAVTGGKGGVGKTTVSANLAASMSRQGHSVMLMDADLGLANVDVLMGLHPKHNLSHVLDGECQLEDVVMEGPEDVLVVPAASGVQKMSDLNEVQHAELIRAFSELDHDIDTLIVDTAAGIGDSVTRFCTAAQEVLVVICDQPASLTDCYGLIKVLNRDHGVNRFRVLSNMVDSGQEGIDLYRRLLSVTDRFLDIEIQYAGCIPNDPMMRRATQKQSLISSAYPRAKASQAYEKLAQQVGQWLIPDQPSGKLEFFFERLVGQPEMEEALA
ncbi:MAG: MinD/ParA family ATP-binding protein [bacterium]